MNRSLGVALRILLVVNGAGVIAGVVGFDRPLQVRLRRADDAAACERAKRGQSCELSDHSPRRDLAAA